MTNHPERSTSSTSARLESDGRLSLQDIVIAGRPSKLRDVAISGFFAGLLGYLLFEEGDSIILAFLGAMALYTFWLNLSFYFRPPRVKLKEGQATFQAISRITTSASNLDNVFMKNGFLAISFSDVSKVEPAAQQAEMKKSFKLNGFHLQLPREAFSLSQINELRRAINLPPQQQDDYLSFMEKLREATPSLPVVTGIVVTNVMVFLVMLASGVSVFEPQLKTMIAWGANYYSLTTQGETWRLITAVFLHFGLIHLLANMIILSEVGGLVERLMGHSGFLISYLLSGLAGSVASVYAHQGGVAAGASGAIFGVFGLLLGFILLQRKSIPAEVVKEHRGMVIFFVAINVFLGLSVSWIDQAAHIGGFLAGCLCGVVLGFGSVAEMRHLWGRVAILAIVGLLALIQGVKYFPHRTDLIQIDLLRAEIEQEAASKYRKLLSQLNEGRVSRTSIAQEIKTKIVPDYEQLRKQLQSIDAGNEKQKELKIQLSRYLSLQSEGWQYLSKAFETGNLVLEGRACLAKEEAIKVLSAHSAHGPQPEMPTDFRTEFVVLLVKDVDVHDAFERIMTEYAEETITGNNASKRIEQEVIQPWQSGRHRFLSAADEIDLPDPQIRRELTVYSNLVEGGWTMVCEGLRQQDKHKTQEGMRLLQISRQHRTDFWGPAVDRR